MEIKAKLKKDSNEYQMDRRQKVAIKATNVSEKHAVVRIYEGEIAAASYITELSLAPRTQVGPVYITAQNIVCEINNDKVGVGVYHD